jgi:hypothetical protein
VGSGEWGVGNGEGKVISLPHSPLPTPFLPDFDLAYAALLKTLAFAVTNAFYCGCVRREGSLTVREGLIRISPPSRSHLPPLESIS